MPHHDLHDRDTIRRAQSSAPLHDYWSSFGYDTRRWVQEHRKATQATRGERLRTFLKHGRRNTQ
jgi:hypothetical protein